MAITCTKVERERERNRKRQRERDSDRERETLRERVRERGWNESLRSLLFLLLLPFVFVVFFRGVGGHRPSFQICSKPKACIMGFERAETGSVLHDTMFPQASLHV